MRWSQESAPKSLFYSFDPFPRDAAQAFYNTNGKEATPRKIDIQAEVLRYWPDPQYPARCSAAIHGDHQVCSSMRDRAVRRLLDDHAEQAWPPYFAFLP